MSSHLIGDFRPAPSAPERPEVVAKRRGRGWDSQTAPARPRGRLWIVDLQYPISNCRLAGASRLRATGFRLPASGFAKANPGQVAKASGFAKATPDKTPDKSPRLPASGFAKQQKGQQQRRTKGGNRGNRGRKQGTVTYFWYPDISITYFWYPDNR